jgi:NitT/TauT family transport system substrate-binding protein
METRAKRAAMMVLGLILLISASGGKAEARVAIGYTSIATGFAATWVTTDAGFFAKNGLDADVPYVPSTTLTAAMLAGRINLGMIGGSSLIEANTRGADFVLLGSFYKSATLTFFITRKEITRPEQLRGKKLGVSRFGAASHRLLEMAVQKMGLDPQKDVTWIQIGNSPLRFEAIRTGNIDGSIFAPSEAFLAKRVGLNVLVDLRDLGVEYLTNDMVTTRKFVKENEDTVRRFVRAVVQGIHYFKTRPEETIRIMAKYLKINDRDYLQFTYDWNAEVYQRKPYVSVGGFNAVVDHLAAANPKVRELKADQFIESKFVRELDESGFIDRLYK